MDISRISANLLVVRAYNSVEEGLKVKGSKLKVRKAIGDGGEAAYLAASFMARNKQFNHG